MEIGQRIAALRGSVSQAKLARDAGVDVSTISRIEGGKIDPTLSTLAAIASALRLPLHRLLDPSHGTVSPLVQPEIVDHRVRLEQVEERLNRLAEQVHDMALARAEASETRVGTMIESPRRSGGKGPPRR